MNEASSEIAPEPALGQGLARPWLGAADMIFLYVLMLGFVRDPGALLDDPDSYWHLQVGREILATGKVPVADVFTFSRSGTPWVDQSWAFDVALAWLHDRAGWSGVLAASVLGLAWLYRALGQWLASLGAGPMSILIASILATRLGQIHFLVRPHLVSFGMVLWFLMACRAFHDDRSRRILWAPLMVALWANLHGGFLAGFVIVGAGALGEAWSGAWDRARIRRLLTFAGVGVACLAAPLLNPYGLGLYRHVAELLVSSGLTAINEEFQPIRIQTMNLDTIEVVILALLLLPGFSRLVPSRFDLAPMVVWFHLAMSSIRYAPLFGLASAPVLARMVDGLLPPRPTSGPSRPWIALLVTLAIAVAVVKGVSPGGPKPSRWPLAALPVLDAQPVERRLFHEQDWGGLIEAHARPRRPVYMDNRFEVFGKDLILEYLRALDGGPDFDAIRDRHDIRLVLVKPDRGLAKRLAEDPAWTTLHRDTVAVLFARK